MLTLRPDAASSAPDVHIDPFCILCGDRGTADALLNVALFLPLGILGARCGAPVAALLVGVALSATIETVQANLPGRFPTLADVVFNAGGVVLGIGLWRIRRRAHGLGPWERAALAGALAAVTLLPALLLAPVYPEEQYYSQWAPSLPGPTTYPGSVVSASIGGHRAPIGRLPRSDSVRSGLRRGGPIRVTFIAAGPPTDRFSPVFRIAGVRDRGIAVVGVSGNDIVVSLRTVGAALAIDAPPLVWEDALEGATSGDTIEVLVRKENGAPCIELDGRTRCNVTPRLRSGWQLLISPDPPGARWTVAMDALWLLLPWAVVGAAMAPGRGRILGAALAAALLVLATGAVTPWIRLSAVDGLLAAAGAGAGGVAASFGWLSRSSR